MLLSTHPDEHDLSEHPGEQSHHNELVLIRNQIGNERIITILNKQYFTYGYHPSASGDGTRNAWHGTDPWNLTDTRANLARDQIFPQNQPIHIPNHLTFEHIHMIAQMLTGHENGQTSGDGDIAYFRDDSRRGYFEIVQTVVFKYDVILKDVVLFQDGGVKYGQVAADYEMPCGFPGYEIDFQSPNARARTYKLVVIPFSPDEWPYFLIWNDNDQNDYQPGCLQKKHHNHLLVVDLSVFCQMTIENKPHARDDRYDRYRYRFHDGWFYACVHVMQSYSDPKRREMLKSIGQVLSKRGVPSKLYPLFWHH